MLQEQNRRAARRKFWSYYPDEGPLRRELYPKHLEFFRAGREYSERLMLAANRVGKTEGVGCYETVCHLTGLYPDWWEGHRFDGPIQAWMAGKTNETTRDILQSKMFGKVTWVQGVKTLTGTGVMPGEHIQQVSWKTGDLLDTVAIKHVSGGSSIIGVKSYQQGRGAFEGTEQNLIYLDEEPPLDIYTECLVRTMTVNGIVILTFTPLEGMSDVVLSFLPGGKLPGGGVI